MAPTDQANRPLVTAVIPLYNHEQYVRESIRSILQQTYPRIELIVINDGSRDHSHDVVLTLVEECKRRFVRFEYINRENVGLSATLNQALDMARGQYFSALASDDLALPNKFTSLVEALESSDDTAAAVFGDASLIDEMGRKISLGRDGLARIGKEQKSYGTFLAMATSERDFDFSIGELGSYQGLLFGNYVPAMATLVKTACIRDVGGWTVGNVIEDWELWLKLSKRHKLVYVDETVALYRIHGRNTYDTMRREMLLAARMLIDLEKEYCFRNGLQRTWEDAFNHQLFRLLKHGRFTFEEKVHALKSAEVLSFIGFLFRARRNTIRRKFRRMAESRTST